MFSIILNVATFFIIDIYLCDGIPISRDGLISSSNTYFTANLYLTAIAIVSLICLTISSLVCVCCNRTNFFKSWLKPEPSYKRNGLQSLNNATNGEISIFPPPGFADTGTLPSTGSQIYFEALPNSASIYLKNNEIKDWFSEPVKNFPRSRLQYVRKLGSGWFGQVLVGRAVGINFSSSSVITSTTTLNPIPVAVKSLREDSSLKEKIIFLKELRPFKDLNHINVMKVLAYCLEMEPFLVILQFCPKSDLKVFLKREKSISEELLLKMMQDVSCGIAHMHQHEFIHTDLAARNCLVDEDLTVKIGDYGLCIEMHQDEYYLTDNIALPIRWCSPETLSCTETTIDSKPLTKEANVWSLGVTIWEILNQGQLPYEDLDDNILIQKVLIEKTRTLEAPTKPSSHSHQISYLLTQCWRPTNERPTATNIHSFLLNVTNEKEDPSIRSVDFSDFDKRWNHLNNDIKTQSHNIVDDSVLNMKFESNFNPEKTLQSLTFSVNSKDEYLEDLDEKMAANFGSAFPSWLGLGQGQLMDSLTEEISEAIQRLDNALAEEEHKDNECPMKGGFRLGKDSLVLNPPATIGDDNLTRRLEQGEFSELVRIKSQSVQDLMRLTVVDSGSDSDRTSQPGSLTDLSLPKCPPEKIFSSESNLKEAVRDSGFMVELERLQAEHKYSIISEVSREGMSSIDCYYSTQLHENSESQSDPLEKQFQTSPQLNETSLSANCSSSCETTSPNDEKTIAPDCIILVPIGNSNCSSLPDIVSHSKDFHWNSVGSSFDDDDGMSASLADASISSRDSTDGSPKVQAGPASLISSDKSLLYNNIHSYKSESITFGAHLSKAEICAEQNLFFETTDIPTLNPSLDLLSIDNTIQLHSKDMENHEKQLSNSIEFKPNIKDPFDTESIIETSMNSDQCLLDEVLQNNSKSSFDESQISGNEIPCPEMEISKTNAFIKSDCGLSPQFVEQIKYKEEAGDSNFLLGEVEEDAFWEKQMTAWREAAAKTKYLLECATNQDIVISDSESNPHTPISQSTKSPYSSNDRLDDDDEGAYVSYDLADDDEILNCDSKNLTLLQSQLNMMLSNQSNSAVQEETDAMFIDYQSNNLSPIKEEDSLDSLEERTDTTVDETNSSSIEFNNGIDDQPEATLLDDFHSVDHIRDIESSQIPRINMAANDNSLDALSNEDAKDSLILEDLEDTEHSTTIVGPIHQAEDAEDVLSIDVENNIVTLIDSGRPQSTIAFLVQKNNDDIVDQNIPFAADDDDDVAPESLPYDHQLSSINHTIPEPEEDSTVSHFQSYFSLPLSHKHGSELDSSIGHVSLPYNVNFTGDFETDQSLQQDSLQDQEAVSPQGETESVALEDKDKDFVTLSFLGQLYKDSATESQEDINGILSFHSTQSQNDSSDEEEIHEDLLPEDKAILEDTPLRTPSHLPDFIWRDETTYTPDWETDSNGDIESSSTSGEFVWQSGNAEVSGSGVSHCKPSKEVKEDSHDEGSESGEEEFIPSTWDRQLTPQRSLLKIQEFEKLRHGATYPFMSDSNKKSVHWKRERHHRVYEYPPEPQSWHAETLQQPMRKIWNTHSLEYLTLADAFPEMKTDFLDDESEDFEEFYPPNRNGVEQSPYAAASTDNDFYMGSPGSAFAFSRSSFTPSEFFSIKREHESPPSPPDYEYLYPSVETSSQVKDPELSSSGDPSSFISPSEAKLNREKLHLDLPTLCFPDEISTSSSSENQKLSSDTRI